MKKILRFIKTFITKKLIEKNILSSNYIYLSTAHNKKIIDQYLIELEKIFKIISKKKL